MEITERGGVCSLSQGRPASVGQEVEIQSKRRLRRRGWWREQRKERLVFASQIFLKNYFKLKKKTKTYFKKLPTDQMWPKDHER